MSESEEQEGDYQDGASLDMTQVHTAWLAAGANGDVPTMRKLQSQFPEWLDLERHVRPASGASRFCSWNGFHLDTLGACALHTAAWEGQLDVMELLLDLGQSPDTPDDNGLTPMMMAIMRLSLMTMRCVFRDGVAVRRNLVVDCRHELEEGVELVISIVELLLRFGACVDAQDQNGKTALHCSTSDDTYEVAKFLLEVNANIDAGDKDGKTPLYFCIQEGGILVTNLLLSKGANIDAVDKDGVSPLLLMLQRADLNVLQLFLNHHQLVATLERRDFSSAVVMLAVDNGVGEVVRYIVENGYASVNLRNAKGETPLHRAILANKTSLMELILGLDTAGDSLVATTMGMQTPAHYAAQYGSPREVETLVLRLSGAFGDLRSLAGANPLNAIDRKERTCLYIVGTASGSSGEDNTELSIRNSKVQLLLDHGARLFPLGYLAQELTSSTNSSRLVLPVQVKYCLQNWLVESNEYIGESELEDPNVHMELFSEFCVQWITSVVHFGSSAMVVAIVASVGHSLEILPLLLDLPLCRGEFTSWLYRLEKLAQCHRGHALLLQLHYELREAWDSLRDL